jgi:hypothetical protein
MQVQKYFCSHFGKIQRCPGHCREKEDKLWHGFDSIMAGNEWKHTRVTSDFLRTILLGQERELQSTWWNLEESLTMLPVRQSQSVNTAHTPRMAGRSWSCCSLPGGPHLPEVLCSYNTCGTQGPRSFLVENTLNQAAIDLPLTLRPLHSFGV